MNVDIIIIIISRRGVRIKFQRLINSSPGYHRLQGATAYLPLTAHRSLSTITTEEKRV